MGQARAPEEIEQLRLKAAALRAAGVGGKRIAKELGIGGSLAMELLRGVPLPSSLARPRAKDDLREAAVLLRHQGRTYDEIKDELGVSKGSLSLWLRDLRHPTPEQRVVVESGVGQPVAGGHDAQPSDREIARHLRREGWLLREIAVALGVAVKTACLWCEGLAVPTRAVHGRDPAHVKAMGRAYWDAELAEREVARQAAMATGAAWVGSLTEREVELVAVTAYWCEGSKSKPWARKEYLTFINSDPGLFRVYLRWLRWSGIRDDQLRLNVSIHESADVKAAEEYWSDVAGVPMESFAGATLKRHNPRTVRKNTGAGYYGCLVIGARGSRDLYRRVAGVWQGIVNAIDAS